MRQDNRPYFIRRLRDRFVNWQTRHFLAPQFDRVGPRLTANYPSGVALWGHGIHAGHDLHIHASKQRGINLSTWDWGHRRGEIHIGNCVLISPGTEIIASQRITIGDSVMIAAGCYISDSDWHGTYDRTAECGKHAPVTLENNVWLGVNVIIGKGVTIGENTIIGAGAVVTRSLPANVIAAGNPAKPVRTLDSDTPRRTRSDYFADPETLAAFFEGHTRQKLRKNTVFGWLRSLIAPRRTD